ncbi:MAG: hypothetical protein KDA32_10275 [Phycisphaerales bacterium]|nr:hypothetical protein [Phycisphaerales bacterium]
MTDNCLLKFVLCAVISLWGCGIPRTTQLVELTRIGDIVFEEGARTTTLQPPSIPNEVRAASLSSSGELAVAWDDGIAVYPSLSSPSARKKVAARTDGLAWSPSGDSLAVVLSKGRTGALVIFDWEILPIFEVELPKRPGRELGNHRTAVSWNTSGSVISISSRSIGGMQIGEDFGHCALFYHRTASGLQFLFKEELSDVAFLSDTHLIANAGREGDETFEFVLGADLSKVEIGHRIDAIAPCNADPLRGIAVLWKRRRLNLLEPIGTRFPVAWYQDGDLTSATRRDLDYQSEVLIVPVGGDREP